MAEPRTTERQFWTRFIELYHENPCLWKLNCKEYTDRDKKTRAYEVLVEKLREIDPNATRDTVTKKINCLRSSHRKEMKKVFKSREEAADESEIYKPTLWYYELLSFLEEHVTLRPSRTSPLPTDCEEVEVCPDTRDYMDDSDGHEDEEMPSVMPSVTAPLVSTVLPRPNRSVKREYAEVKREYVEMARKLPSPAREHTKPYTPTTPGAYTPTTPAGYTPTTPAEDEWDLVGKNVATKLRRLSDRQKVFAERLINEVLFQGQVNGLNLTSSLTTQVRNEPNSRNQELLKDWF